MSFNLRSIFEEGKENVATAAMCAVTILTFIAVLAFGLGIIAGVIIFAVEKLS